MTALGAFKRWISAYGRDHNPRVTITFISFAFHPSFLTNLLFPLLLPFRGLVSYYWYILLAKLEGNEPKPANPFCASVG